MTSQSSVVINLCALILAGFSSSSLAISGYAPPIAFERNSVTYTINKDGSYREDAVDWYRIENEQGVSKYGEEDIAYIPKLESVAIKEAYTITPDGKRIEVPGLNIRTTNDELDRGGAMYSDMKHKMVIYPNVVPGSQIYLEYTKIVHTPDFPGQFTARESTSSFSKYASYEVSFNFDPGINVRFETKGFDGGKLPDKRGMHCYRFTRRQDTFFAPEENQVSEDDFDAYVLASTFKSYVALGSAYQAKAREKVKITPAIQHLADELTKGADDQRRQARRLYDWVARNIRYVASYIGNGGFVPHDSQTILDNQWGDCKDHAVILEALLAAKGIASSPALINAEPSYFMPALPADVFDHVITYVPGLDMYLDSTDQFAPFGSLPASDLNKTVILTALNKMGQTPPMRAEDHKSMTSIKLKVLPDGTITGSSHTRTTGDSEINLRNWQFDHQTEPQDGVINSLLSDADLTGRGQIHATDPSDLDKPLEIDTSFTIDPVSNVPGPAAMPIPAGAALEVIDGKMMSKPEDRLNFPRKCESFTYRNNYEIEFPPNIHIKHIPEDVSYSDGMGQYTATYKLHGTNLEIDRELIVQHPAMVCGEAENELEKKFFPYFERDMRAQVIYE